MGTEGAGSALGMHWGGLKVHWEVHWTVHWTVHWRGELRSTGGALGWAREVGGTVGCPGMHWRGELGVQWGGH